MEQLSKIQVESFETKFKWTIPNFCDFDMAEWTRNKFLLSEKFSFDNIDVSGYDYLDLNQMLS